MIQSKIFGWESRDVLVAMEMKQKTLTELNLHDNRSNFFLLIQRKHEKIASISSRRKKYNSKGDQIQKFKLLKETTINNGFLIVNVYIIRG